MTVNTQNTYELPELDLVAIERQARAMQAQAFAAGFASLRRGIVNLFSRGTEARTA